MDLSCVWGDCMIYLPPLSMVVSLPPQVKQLMRQGGAVREFYMSDLVTHLITDAPLEPSVAANPDITIVHVCGWHRSSCICKSLLFSFITPPSFSLSLSSQLSFSPSFLLYCCLLPHPSPILFPSQSDWVKMSMKCEAMLPYPTSIKLREVTGGKWCNFKCMVASFPGYSSLGMRLDKQLFS